MTEVEAVNLTDVVLVSEIDTIGLSHDPVLSSGSEKDAGA
jgi:hypothetical protein